MIEELGLSIPIGKKNLPLASSLHTPCLQKHKHRETSLLHKHNPPPPAKNTKMPPSWYYKQSHNQTSSPSSSHSGSFFCAFCCVGCSCKFNDHGWPLQDHYSIIREDQRRPKMATQLKIKPSVLKQKSSPLLGFPSLA